VDAHLVALDAKTGSVLWDVKVADDAAGHSITVAPLVVKDMVICGISGGEYGIRGFLDAYDAATDARRWRFWTIPEPVQPLQQNASKGLASSRGPMEQPNHARTCAFCSPLIRRCLRRATNHGEHCLTYISAVSSGKGTICNFFSIAVRKHPFPCLCK